MLADSARRRLARGRYRRGLRRFRRLFEDPETARATLGREALYRKQLLLFGALAVDETPPGMRQLGVQPAEAGRASDPPERAVDDGLRHREWPKDLHDRDVPEA